MRVYASLLRLIGCMVVILYSLLLDYKQNTAHADNQIYRYYSASQLTCLYQNIYHESRNQPIAGQLAVMYVTLNRVSDSRFPNTICGVVTQGPHRLSWKKDGGLIPLKHQCHFSWYCDGKSDEIQDQISYDAIVMLVDHVIKGSVEVFDITEGATHYHADYVRPAWADTKTKTVEIEDHIFYRWEI